MTEPTNDPQISRSGCKLTNLSFQDSGCLFIVTPSPKQTSSREQTSPSHLDCKHRPHKLPLRIETLTRDPELPHIDSLSYVPKKKLSRKNLKIFIN